MKGSGEHGSKLEGWAVSASYTTENGTESRRRTTNDKLWEVSSYHYPSVEHRPRVYVGYQGRGYASDMNYEKVVFFLAHKKTTAIR